MLADVHAHLDHPDFDSDLDKVIARAKDAGVSLIITNGTDIKDNRKCIEIGKKYPLVKVALGLYPIEALKLTDKEIDEELKFIESQKDKIVAIGEVGLDYYWEKDPIQWEREKEVFKKIIALAEKLQKPLIVHSRGAEEDAVNMLLHAKTRVVMHMFCGNMELVDRAINAGFYFSIPTTLIRSKNFKKVVKKVNINKILTETDAPFLAPDPKEKNEPKNVAITVKEIAKIKNFTEEEAIRNIWRNTQELFLG